MADRLSKDKRSENMAAIKSKGTEPELYIRKLLFAAGYRYRNNTSKICGHPDLWLGKYNTAIFVNGCFWHRHDNCKLAYIPKSREDYWKDKFSKNVLRDQRNKNELLSRNIKQLIIWECTIRRMKRDNKYEQHIIEEIIEFLNSDVETLEL